jgi:D-alanine-D-alanine ligase
MPEKPTAEQRHPRTVAVVYGAVLSGAPGDEQSVLEDVNAVSDSLRTLGYEPVAIAATLNLAELISRLKEMGPSFVFNLVEGLSGYDSLLHLVPAALEAYRIPYTGVSVRAHFCTTDKILAKDIMSASGIATPPCQRCDDILKSGLRIPLACIVKPVSADASIGMDENAVCLDQARLKRKLDSLPPGEADTYFAEGYIEGREFNISVLSSADGAEILPPAEMTFVDFPAGKPAIVDYRAKWVQDSFEYTHTIRRFAFSASDKPLVDELRRICLQCWSVFQLDGYARVDLRVDKAGKPWVLEINGNPCISQDAGLMAAAGQAGLSFDDVIRRIVDHVLTTHDIAPLRTSPAEPRGQASL